MSDRQKLLRTLGTLLVVVVALDLLAWAGHVAWRSRALADLEPVAEQIEVLAGQIAEDDGWIRTNTDLMQEYGQPDRYAARVTARGRRATTHGALVEAYNEQVVKAYRRFYWVPLPAPDPPVREHLPG